MDKGYVLIQKEKELDSLYDSMVKFNLTSLDKEIWLELISDGIINPDVMEQQIKRYVEKNVKLTHLYAFTPCSDGRLAHGFQMNLSKEVGEMLEPLIMMH